MTNIRVGNAVAETGQIVRGSLPIGERADGTQMTCPVAVASGREPGPVLWLQACVHGDEVGGTLALQAFLRELAPCTHKGVVVCVMIANPQAFCDGRRSAFRDGTDLNRVFPGKASGTLHERVAFTLSQAALDVADAVVDFHSGGLELECCHYVIYSAGFARTLELARSLGAARLLETPGDTLRQAAYSDFAHRGLPAAIVESGGAGSVSQMDLDNFSAAARGACSFLGILPPLPERPVVQFGRRYLELRACKGGIYEPLVAAGDVLRPCTLIEHVLDAYGDVVQMMHAPDFACWAAGLRRRRSAVTSGDLLAEIVASSPWSNECGT